MEAQQAAALVLRLETVFRYLEPDLAGRPVFGNFFEKIVVGIKEETEPRPEVIHVETAALRPLYVLDAVVQRESQFLQGGRAGLANVVSADRDGVEPGRKPGTKLEGIHHQAHRRRGWIDIFLLRDVLLQDVVL